jgi:MoxR-like ATPase
MQLQQDIKKIHVSDRVKQYIISLIIKARQDPDVLTGPSTRASIALFKGSRSLAYLQNRDYVIPDDVKKLIQPVFAHRLELNLKLKWMM